MGLRVGDCGIPSGDRELPCRPHPGKGSGGTVHSVHFGQLRTTLLVRVVSKYVQQRPQKQVSK